MFQTFVSVFPVLDEHHKRYIERDLGTKSASNTSRVCISTHAGTASDRGSTGFLVRSLPSARRACFASARRCLRQYLRSGELANGGFEDASVEIDVGVSGGGRHQRHIVERGEQNAAIQCVEMHVALETEIGRGSGFSAIARRVRAEKIFGTAA